MPLNAVTDKGGGDGSLHENIDWLFFLQVMLIHRCCFDTAKVSKIDHSGRIGRDSTFGPSIENEPDLQVSPDRCRLAVARPHRRRERQEIINDLRPGHNLIQHRGDSITSSRFKGQAGNKRPSVCEPEHRSRVKQYVARLRGRAFSRLVLVHDRGRDLKAEAEGCAVIYQDPEWETNRRRRLKFRRNGIPLERHPRNDKAEITLCIRVSKHRSRGGELQS